MIPALFVCILANNVLKGENCVNVIDTVLLTERAAGFLISFSSSESRLDTMLLTVFNRVTIFCTSHVACSHLHCSCLINYDPSCKLTIFLSSVRCFRILVTNYSFSYYLPYLHGCGFKLTQ